MNDPAIAATQRIELRITTQGECTCGTVHSIDNWPPVHGHHIECDWGRIEHPDPRPDRGEVGHLILAMGWTVGANLAAGPVYHARDVDDDGRVRWQEYTATEQDGRIFLHTAWPVYSHGDGTPSEDGSEEPPTGCQRFTWELFLAHFADGKGPEDIWIGRWPD